MSRLKRKNSGQMGNYKIYGRTVMTSEAPQKQAMRGHWIRDEGTLTENKYSH
jgi:hypothetical protein